MYELKIDISATKDGEPFFSSPVTYSNLSYEALLLIQGVMHEAQSKLLETSKELARKGKK